MDCMDCIWFIKVNKRDVDMVILFIYLFIYLSADLFEPITTLHNPPQPSTPF